MRPHNAPWWVHIIRGHALGAFLVGQHNGQETRKDTRKDNPRPGGQKDKGQTIPKNNMSRGLSHFLVAVRHIIHALVRPDIFAGIIQCPGPGGPGVMGGPGDGWRPGDGWP